MTAVGPPLASGWAVTIRKHVRAEGSLEEHVRAGALSRSMAVLLEGCVAARANVLVVGSGTGVVASMIAALALGGGGRRAHRAPRRLRRDPGRVTLT